MTLLRPFLLVGVLAWASPAPAQTYTDYGVLTALLTKLSGGKLANDPPQLLALAQNPYCLQYREVATNEFSRRDFLAKLREQILAQAATVSDEIRNVGRMYNLSEYNFATKSFKILTGEFEWESSIGWGDLAYLKTCWKGFPHIVDVLPDWKLIPTQLQVPEDEARSWYAAGKPRVALTVTVKAKGYTLEPMLQPKFIIRGDTLAWKLEIKDPKFQVLKTYTSEDPGRAPAAPSTATSLPPASAMPRGRRTVTVAFNARSQPSVASPLFVTLQPGQTVMVDGSNPEGTWSRVSVPERAGDGWVLNSVLLKNSNPARN
jgi:hypothetical protein